MAGIDTGSLIGINPAGTLGLAGSSGGNNTGNMFTPGNMLTGGLLGMVSSLFAGIGKSAEEKRKWANFMKRMNMLKPETPYYGVEKGLPQIDPIVQKVIMGMLGQRGVDMGGLGITPEMMAGIGGQTPTRRILAPMASRPTGGQGRM